MAKFKVGDRVEYWFFNEPYKGTVVRSTDYTTTIKFDNKPPAWMPQVAELPTDNIVRSNSRACNGVRSTNAVVVKALNACGTARNANEWIDDPKKKKAMDEIDKKADALYRQLKDIARKFDALKNEQVKVGFYFADYSDAARQIREIHGME